MPFRPNWERYASKFRNTELPTWDFLNLSLLVDNSSYTSFRKPPRTISQFVWTASISGYLSKKVFKALISSPLIRGLFSWLVTWFHIAFQAPFWGRIRQPNPQPEPFVP